MTPKVELESVVVKTTALLFGVFIRGNKPPVLPGVGKRAVRQ